jgi:hypothetical protein
LATCSPRFAILRTIYRSAHFAECLYEAVVLTLDSGENSAQISTAA